MDPSSGHGKRRFAPTPPKASRRPKNYVPKTEEDNEDKKAEQAQRLLHQFTAIRTRQGPKVEKKSSVQVAFGCVAKSPSTTRTMSLHRDGNGGKSTEPGVEHSASNDGQDIVSFPSTTDEDGTDANSLDAVNTSVPEAKNSYKEPWDYHNSYYPTTLPWRRPFSGDPELLDKVEFGEAARNQEYDENTINPALELGMLEECNKERMFFFQLPDMLPLAKQSANRKGKEKAEGSIPGSWKGCCLEDLPGGYMGKMLVYKSGAIKMKLGEVLYDVSPGSDLTIAQDVVAINTKEKYCCAVGDLHKRVIVIPDIDSLLNSTNDLRRDTGNPEHR